MPRATLGPAMARLLKDPAVVDVMLKPDGRTGIDRLFEWVADTRERLSDGDGERIVRLLAHHVRAEVTPFFCPMRASFAWNLDSFGAA